MANHTPLIANDNRLNPVTAIIDVVPIAVVVTANPLNANDAVPKSIRKNLKGHIS